MERCALGLVGWGTVGGGVVSILARDGALLAERTGIDLRVKTIVTRTPSRVRAQRPDGAAVGDRLEAILDDPEIRVVVLLVGGTGEAKSICERLIRARKQVVTANKALIAVHGDELFALAAQHGVGIAFEAAVAGGIPVIAALRDGLVANRIESICAILNGTCNFILTKMEVESRDYRDALAEAQRLGYAEADPTLDVDGTDTAHKLAILARIAFNRSVPLTSVRVEGIQGVSARDIASARTMGCRIKLLAVAKSRPEGIELRVAPTLVPLDHPLASVMWNHNGVHVVGNATGPQLFTGQGAGAEPTASAVLADVVDVASGRYQATTAHYRFFQPASAPAFLPETEEITSSYARFLVPDRPGVLAGIINSLAHHGASVLSIHQGAADPQGQTSIEVTTHPMRGGAFLAAVSEVDRRGLTLSPTTCYRRL